jgi:IS605 OrfB family transposase
VYTVQKNHLRTHVDGYETLKWLSHKCKNLYNVALYTIRNHFDITGSYISESELFQTIKSHQTYKELHSDNAQLTLRMLRQNFRSFFKLLKLKKQGQYKEDVTVPHYLPKDGYFVAQFIKRQLKREGNKLRLSLGRRGKQSLGTQFVWVTIPANIHDKVIHMVRIVPKFRGEYFEIEFIYNPELTIPKFDLNHFLSIDLGLDNFTTAVTTKETAFILEGRGIKSYNQWWNKQKAELQSTYDKNGRKWGYRLKNLHIKRYNVFRNYLSHTVHHIVKHCLKYQIGNIIIGEWKDMKRGLRMRKKTSQSFQQVPYATFKKRLESKCAMYGIQIFLVDESYTSRTCCRCGIVRKANRVKRGLYRCRNCKIERNADINGAINIMKKVVPKDVLRRVQWDSGDIISPKRVKLVNFIT